MSTKASLSEFEAYFGFDPRGQWFSQAMQSPCLMNELLRAENYNGYNRVMSVGSVSAVQAPEDVPQDVTDLIINTAWFHRSIDKSSTAGTNLGEAANRIAKAFSAFLEKNNDGTFGTDDSVGSSDAGRAAAAEATRAATAAATKAAEKRRAKEELQRTLAEIDKKLNDLKTQQAAGAPNLTATINALNVQLAAVKQQVDTATLAAAAAAAAADAAGVAANEAAYAANKLSDFKDDIHYHIAIGNNELKSQIDAIANTLAAAAPQPPPQPGHSGGNMRGGMRGNMRGGSSIADTYNLNNKTIGELYMFLAADKAIFELHNKGGEMSQQLSSNTNATINKMFHEDSTLYKIVLEGTASKALDLIESASAGTNIKKNIKAAVARKMQNIYTNIIRKMMEDMSQLYSNLGTDNRIDNDSVGAFNRKTVEVFLQTNLFKYNNMFLNSVTSEVPQAIQKAVAFDVEIPHTALDSVASKKFFKAVYGNWANMHQAARTFYLEFVGLFAKSNASSLYDTKTERESSNMDWVRLSDLEVDAIFTRVNEKTITDADFKNLRVNLMKDQSNGKVLLTAYLPTINSGSNVWYTRADTSIGVVRSPPNTFLVDLYERAYADGPMAILKVGTVILENLETDPDKRPKNNFNLNHGKFMAAVIKCEDAERENDVKKESNPVSDELDYPFLTAYDMVYGKIWTYDAQAQQYYRVDENNRKVYYDEYAKGNVDTCYASYLGSGKNGCERVIKCILDGNPSTLKNCLEDLSALDLWKVAANDAQKVGPDMVKLVLRKFGVKGREETDSNGITYKVPMSFDEWKQDVVSGFGEEVQKTILGNTNLINYLKGLIAICRSNPSILNKHNPSIIARENKPKILENLNIPRYYNLSQVTKTPNEFFAEILRNQTPPPPVSMSSFDPLLLGNFSNVSYISPLSTYVPSLLGGNYYKTLKQSGGNPGAYNLASNLPGLPSRGTSFNRGDKENEIIKDGSASKFRALIANIYNAFSDVGLQLHPDDHQKILAVVKKMENYENQFARLCTVLITIVKLARFYGVSLENVDREHPRVMKNLHEINNLDDIKDFIRCYVRDLTKNMMSNLTVQQATAYDLQSRAMPKLLDEASGKSTVQQQAASVASAKGWVNL